MLRPFSTRHAGFTLVEIMIVVAIIALLASIAVPNFIRSRKRSQATHILEDLRQIDQAIDLYAVENNKRSDDSVNWTDIQRYLKPGSRLAVGMPQDILQGYYFGGIIEEGVQLSQETFDELSDVAPIEFWAPFAVHSGVP